MAVGRTHVWLLGPGAPRNQDAAAAWLRALLSDPDAVTPGLPAFLRGLWVWWLCWRGTPLLEDHTARGQAELDPLELLAIELSRVLGPHYAVQPVRRYDGSAVHAARDAGKRDRVVLLPVHAHVGGPTTISPLRHAHRALAGHPAPRAEVRGYPDAAGYLDAVAETLREAILALPEQDAPVDPYEVVFVGRGLPGAPGPYPDQLQATVAAIVRGTRLAAPHHLAWTRPPGRRSGPAPQLLDLVAERGAAGVRALVLVPLGWSFEHPTVRVELDQDAVDAAHQAGVQHVQRAATVASRPRFVRHLADLVREAEAQADWDVPWRMSPAVGRAP